MKRALLLAIGFAIPMAHAQLQTTTVVAATTPTPAQVLALAPQLLAFAGSDTNFASLVNGLALGVPVTLTTPLATGGSQVFTFTPTGTMGTLAIAQTLENARQLLISRGVATPTAQQLGTALTGGSLTTPTGTTTVSAVLPGATTTTTAAAGASGAQSPATAIQATNSAPSTNAAAGSTTGAVRNMSDTPFPRGMSDTPPLPIPGVTSPLNTPSTEVARPAITPAAPVAPALTPPAARMGDR